MVCLCHDIIFLFFPFSSVQFLSLSGASLIPLHTHMVTGSCGPVIYLSHYYYLSVSLFVHNFLPDFCCTFTLYRA